MVSMADNRAVVAGDLVSRYMSMGITTIVIPIPAAKTALAMPKVTNT